MKKISSLAIVASITIGALAVGTVSLLSYQAQQYRYCSGEDPLRWRMGPSEYRTLRDFRLHKGDPILLKNVATSANGDEATRVLCRAVSQAAFVSFFRNEAN